MDGARITWHASTSLEEPEWDQFLTRTPLGHIQQASRWALARQPDGWQPLRVLLSVDDELAGGFQLLTRTTRLGRIGYIYKGPVLTRPTPAMQDLLLGQVVATARDHRLRVVIAQPPDADAWPAKVFARHGFVDNHVFDVIAAGMLVDLAPGLDAVWAGLHKSTREQLRRAERKGVHVRLGDTADLAVFFRMMVATCERQRTAPSPASEEALRAIWNALAPPGWIRLWLAECEGECVAGLLGLCFGSRVTLWKKGWSGRYRERNPNRLLTFEAIRWAQQNGFALFDIARLDKQLALALQRGETPGQSEADGRDLFFLGFGGRPVVLPDSFLYVANPLLRPALKNRALCRGLRKLARW